MSFDDNATNTDFIGKHASPAPDAGDLRHSIGFHQIERFLTEDWLGCVFHVLFACDFDKPIRRIRCHLTTGL